MQRVIAGLLLCLAGAVPVHAADISIMAIPREVSKLRAEDYLDTLKTIREAAPGKLFVSLWTWEKLEPEKDETIVEKELGGINYAIEEHGFIPYCGVTVIDTVKRVLPEDLRDAAWDDPRLITRYREIIQQVKKYQAAPPAYFVIANEADVYFEKHPDELPAFLHFVASAKRAIREAFPEAVIGISGTYEGLHRGGERARIVRSLIAASDAAFYTFYPVIDLKPVAPAQTPALLDAMIRAAGDKAVVLQEVGYPSRLAATSPQLQADFFATIIPAIQSRPQIAVAAIFALHDFDEATCDYLGGYYGFGGLAKMTPWVRDFRAFICSLGLKEADGTPKPSWSAVLHALRTSP